MRDYNQIVAQRVEQNTVSIASDITINIVSPVSKIKAQYLNEDKLITTDEVDYIGQQLDAGVEFGDTFDVEDKPINMGAFGFMIPGGYFGVVKSFD